MQYSSHVDRKTDGRDEAEGKKILFFFEKMKLP